MFALLLIWLLAQASPGPAAPTPLGRDWLEAPLGDMEYASFVRRESDGSRSRLVATKQVCDCQPAQLVSDLQTALQNRPGAKLQRTSVTLCGASAEHLVVRLAMLTSSQLNFDIYVFRQGDSLYSLRYYFRAPEPVPEDEVLMSQLCPKGTPGPAATQGA